jgi:DMSO/TMAO reductase YedYZ molybdopterin-dependent catalytic subunit
VIRKSKLRKPLLQSHSATGVPPGQFITDKWPVLTFGTTPQIQLKNWRFLVFGLVEDEVELTWEQFLTLPQSSITADFHCVTQWTRLDNHWGGVLFKNVFKLIRPLPEAQYVMVHCFGDYSTNLSLRVLMEDDVIFAHSHDGTPLEPDHGGPLRLVIPKRYGWKSAKWVMALQFMANDEPGFWEAHDYDNNGNPWMEERFNYRPE